MRAGLPVAGRRRPAGPRRVSCVHARCAELGQAARVLGRAVELGFPFSSKVINVYSIWSSAEL